MRLMTDITSQTILYNCVNVIYYCDQIMSDKRTRFKKEAKKEEAIRFRRRKKKKKKSAVHPLIRHASTDSCFGIASLRIEYRDKNPLYSSPCDIDADSPDGGVFPDSVDP